MNEDLILKLVQPVLVNNTITYDKFESVFSMLSRKEQYSVINLLSNHGIILSDEYPDDNNQAEETELIEVDDVFIDDYDDLKESEERYNEPLIVRKSIKMDNRTIIRLIQEGSEQAKQDLCIKNRAMVKKCVSMYQNLAGNKLEFEDLEQVGMIGMLKAAERFDLKNYGEFSTYAMYWIKQCIVREIYDKGFTIRIPVHKMEQIQKVCRLDSKYLHIADRNKRIEKISQESGYTKAVVEDCLILYSQYLRCASLDMPVGEEEESTLAEFVPIDNEITTEEAVMNSTLKEEMKKAVQTLSEREQKVLNLRFGLEDGVPRTLEYVGMEMGVTRERIRQIEAKALRKLRHPSRSRNFKGYYYD